MTTMRHLTEAAYETTYTSSISQMHTVLALDALEKGEPRLQSGDRQRLFGARSSQRRSKRYRARYWRSRCPAPAGDPAVLIANPDRIQRELGWKPVHSEINSILESAWVWRLAHPHGYGR